MKQTSLQIGFGASFIIHALAFGAVAWYGVVKHPPAIELEDSSPILTLIAAPLETEISSKPPVNQPVVVAIPSQPEPSVPPPAITPVVTPEPIQATVEPLKPIVPANPDPPVTMPAHPVEMASAAPQHNLRGDGSSQIPGPDPATSEAQVSVAAKAHPKYLSNPEPRYPTAARRRHQEGTVLLKVKVTAAGQTAAVTVEHSSGFPLLDDAAVRAVHDWQFQPAQVGDQPVNSDIEVPIRFKLAD